MPGKKKATPRRQGPVLEATTAGFMDALVAAGGPPIYKMSVPDARNVLNSLQSKPVAKLAAQIEDLKIPAGPAGEILIRIIRPEQSSGALPAVIYTHGGGWVLGNANTHDRLVRELANGINAAIVFVNYTPSPEAKYPTAIEEAYATAKYIAVKGAAPNIDSKRIAICGDSAGGNMVAAVALLAKDRGSPKFLYQVMLYPVTDAGMNTASYKQFANGPGIPKTPGSGSGTRTSLTSLRAKSRPCRHFRRRLLNSRVCRLRCSSPSKTMSCATRERPTAGSSPRLASR